VGENIPPGRRKSLGKKLESNKVLWDALTGAHVKSAFYDVEGFIAGKDWLRPLETEEVGDVHGKSLLHLQCHFGMDTLSWARLGAKVTCVDFSDKAINLARSLSNELGIKAEFICCDIYDLPKKLKSKFDIVYTSGGVLCWLPDLVKWAEIIAHFLKPGGFFYIFEGHPFMMVFDDARDVTEPRVRYSYFHGPEPDKWEPEGDYAEPDAVVTHGSYEWNHRMGDIINSLINAGLRIEFFHEFPMIFFKRFPFMEQDDDGGGESKAINYR
jgi:SAM-dependent methyltransferase